VTDDRARTDRVIDLTIDIDATLEEVWQALTTGEGIVAARSAHDEWTEHARTELERTSQRSGERSSA
jgi:uncharacterized protein YndB with AHSA1/START domain